MSENADRLVNMEELGRVFKVSVPTVRRWLADHEDFPVEQHGGHGVAYVFDVDKVKAWLEQHKSEAAEADAERQRQLELLSKELYGETPDELQGLSVAQRKQLAEAIRLEDYNRARRGELVERAPLEAMLSQALVQTRTRLLQVPAQLTRRAGLNREQRVMVEQLLEGTLRELARGIAEAIDTPDGEEGEDDARAA